MNKRKPKPANGHVSLPIPRGSTVSVLQKGSSDDTVISITVPGGRVANTDLIELITTKRDDYIRKYFRKLMGKGIGMNEAAEEYSLNQPTISKWTARGFIGRIGSDKDDPTKVLVDQADVAYCARAYELLAPEPGRKLFNRDGSIYIPKEFAFA